MGSSADELWERLPVLDEWDEDGRRAIYVDDQVIVVSTLAVVALAALPADIDTVAAALVREFGDPPQDLREFVRSALSELNALGLVVHRTSTSG